MVNLKAGRGLLSEPAASPSAVAADKPPQRDLSQQLANRSITVAAVEPGSASGGTDKDRLLPLGKSGSTWPAGRRSADRAAAPGRPQAGIPAAGGTGFRCETGLAY